MFKYVTLTGADDSVDPQELINLSFDFPFVEWGILIGTRAGLHRFPSMGWIGKLVKLKHENANRFHPIHLSLHICGRWLREIAKGTPLSWPTEFLAFERCQLNWHGETQGDISSKIVQSFQQLKGWNPTVIFQFDGVNDHLCAACAESLNVAALFDQSHGAGLLPERWNRAIPDFPCGHAGGLGADNVAVELPKIMPMVDKAQYAWIDMETKLFTGERFDLRECGSVLAQAAPFVEATA